MAIKVSHINKRFGDFVEPDVDSSGDVAAGVRRHRDLQGVVGSARQIHAQVALDAAGPTGEPGQTELRRQLGRDDSSGLESVLQASVLVVDRSQPPDFGFELERLRAQVL